MQVVEPIARFSQANVTALDGDGMPVDLHTEGLLAICIQHEVDHLDGKVFVDYLSQLKRDRIRKRLVREPHSEHPTSCDKENVPVI